MDLLVINISNINRLLSRISEDNFDKLFTRIMRVWDTKDGLRNPRLSKVVASLVCPMHTRMSMTRYLHLLETISSILHKDIDIFIEGSLEVITHPGPMIRVFQVLKYVTLPEEIN